MDWLKDDDILTVIIVGLFSIIIEELIATYFKHKREKKKNEKDN